MKKLNITWLYPDLLNLHGDRGNLMAFERIGGAMGLDVKINRVDTFAQEIDFDGSDMIFMNVGEVKTAEPIAKSIRRYGDEIYDFAEADKPIIAIGTSGMTLIKSTQRCDGSVVEGLGILDAKAIERSEVYGNDLHFTLCDDEKIEIMAVQIQLVDFYLSEMGQALGRLDYGVGNNGKDGTEGAKYKNVIFTNALGPMFVKNPWYTEKIINDALRVKGCEPCEPLTKTFFEIERNSFDAVKRFIKRKKD